MLAGLSGVEGGFVGVLLEAEELVVAETAEDDVDDVVVLVDLDVAVEVLERSES
jgi:hypothetical protein